MRRQTFNPLGQRKSRKMYASKSSRFLTDCGCTDQILALQQISKHRYILHKPMKSIFLDVRAVLDSSHRRNQSAYKPLNTNGQSQVREHGYLSPELIKSGGVRQGGSVSSLFLNFVTETAMELALSSCENGNIDIFSQIENCSKMRMTLCF